MSSKSPKSKKHAKEEEESKMSPKEQQQEAKHKGKKESPKRKGVASEVAEEKKGTPPKKAKPEAEAEKEYKVSMAVLNSLVKDKCDSLGPIGTLYTVRKAHKIEDVWGSLIGNNYMSAPVVTEDGYFEGFVDLVDVASYLVATFGQMVHGDRRITELSGDIRKELDSWMSKSVRDIMDFSADRRRPPPITTVCYSGYSVLSALEPLARERGAHRVAVVKSPGSMELLHLITQSQALHYVFNNLATFGSKKWKKIEDCADVFKTVYAVSGDSYVLAAFEHMLANNVTAVAVVHDSKLVDVVRLKDLHVLSKDCRNLPLLYGQTSAFMTHVKEHEKEKPEKPVSPMVRWTCRKEDTLGKVVKHMQSHACRHLFVVDDQLQPTGVVTMKEVLLELLS